MTVVDVLRRARDLLLTKGWTQGAFARNKYGRSITALSRDAVCYCAYGAIDRASRRGKGDLAEASCDLLRRAARFRSSTSKWNDRRGRTKREVLRAFAKAIRIGEREANP